jgi:hypothetical protein
MHPPKLLRPPKNWQTEQILKLRRNADPSLIITHLITLSKRLDRAEYLLGPLARPRGALDFWAK